MEKGDNNEKYMNASFSFVTLFVVICMSLLSFPAYAAADSSKPTLTKSIISDASKYISLSGYQYILDENEAKNELTAQEVRIVDDQITRTNKTIEEMLQSTEIMSKYSVMVQDNKLIFIDSERDNIQSNRMMRAQALYKEGVTKVEFGWSGLKIYLSKTDINQLGSLVLGNSIYLPAGIGQIVAAALGFTAGQLPGGVVFESTLSDLVFLRITNIRFQ